MANYAALKAIIDTYIKTRVGSDLITGPELNYVLTNTVDSLINGGYLFAGVASVDTDPGVPDPNVFYIATESGEYDNFDGVVLEDGEAAALVWDGTWHKQTTGLATKGWVNTRGFILPADIFEGGLIKSSLLPGFVDDVKEYPSLSQFPQPGVGDMIYIAVDTNKQYRWSGTQYVEISSSLALGETASTAYAGDKGKRNADNIATLQGYFDANGKMPWSRLTDVPDIVNTFGEATGDITLRTNATARGQLNFSLVNKELRGEVVLASWALAANRPTYSYGDTDLLGFGTAAEKNVAYFLAADNFTADNIVSTLGDTSVNRATADASGNVFTTHYATASDLQDFKDLFDSMFAKEAKTGGGYRIKAKFDFYSDGSVAAGGIGTGGGGGGGGTVTAVRVNGTTYEPASGSSIINLPDYPTRTSLGIGSLASYDTVSQALGYTPYNASNPNGYISGITSSMVTNALGYTPANVSALASYLPLDGGTMNNNAEITFAASSENLDTWIKFKDPSVTRYLGIRRPFASYGLTFFDGTNYYQIIHTGNIGSQSVNYANSAGSVAWTNVSDRPTTLSQFTDDVVSGHYLPLSGGTLTGTLTINVGYAYTGLNIKGSYSEVWTHYTASSGECYIGIANGLPAICMGTGNNQYIYHTGNANKSDVSWSVSNLSCYGASIVLNQSTGTYNKTLIHSDANAFYIEARMKTDSSSGDKVPMYFGWRGGNYPLTIAANTNVGIGTTTPSQKLTVSGNIVATGQIAAGQASDLRLKDNITKICNAVSILRNLRGVEFDWNGIATEKCSTLKGHDVGLIAQEVMPYIPSAVSTIFEDYYRLDYTKLTPYLLAGWQEHDTEIERLKRRVAELEREVKRLRA